MESRTIGDSSSNKLSIASSEGHDDLGFIDVIGLSIKFASTFSLIKHYSKNPTGSFRAAQIKLNQPESLYYPLQSLH